MTWWKKKITAKISPGGLHFSPSFFFFWRFLEHVRENSFYIPTLKERKKKKTNWYSLLFVCMCVWGLVSLFSRSRRRKDSCKSTTNFCLGNPYLDHAAQSVRPWISIWAWCSSSIYIHTQHKMKKNITRIRRRRRRSSKKEDPRLREEKNRK